VEFVSDKLFNRTGVRYEVACDVIGALISHYAALIATEEDKDGPDQDTIVKAEAAQKALRDQRDALDSNDAEAIEAVIAHYGPQARAVSNP
jgi:microcompartment protein CcmK/EutM